MEQASRSDDGPGCGAESGKLEGTSPIGSSVAFGRRPWNALLTVTSFWSRAPACRRQGLHRRVAEALRDDVTAPEPELLAHHFTHAGLADPPAMTEGFKT
jgi:hypothetical protein